MRKTLIPHVMRSVGQPELRNQEVIDYKVWTNNVGFGYWGDSGNWSNNTKPSGGSNVLFGPYQGVCIINEHTSGLGGFRVRQDHDQYIVGGLRGINVTGYFTYYSLDNMSFSYATFNISKDVRIGGQGNLFWDRSVWNISGGFNQKDLDTPVDNYSTINMLGSGKTVYSEDELNRLNIIGDTYSSGTVIIEGALNVSGELNIPSGSEVINRGSSSDVSIYNSGSTAGGGDLILEREAQLIRQLGYIGNENLIIRNNNIGEVLPASVYSAKNLIISNISPYYNAFIFSTGNYHFDSDVTILVSGGGTLEINNRFKGATVNFNRDLTINSGAFSDVVWKTGNGSVVFGKSSSIAKAFNKNLCERSGVNVVDNIRGLAMSYKNQINNEPIIWALHSGDLDLATSGVGIRAFTQAGHTVGYFIAQTNTIATGFGDLCISQMPSFTAERFFIGDIADPNATRPIIRIYRAVEPSVTGYGFFSDAVPTIYNLAYPSSPVGDTGGIQRDARAFALDYNTSDIYIVTHNSSPPQLFYLEGDNVYVGTQTLGFSGTLNIESGVVGLDIARDGKQILVKTWENLYYYRVTGNNTICQTLTGTTPIKILDYSAGYQEHGVSWGSGRYLNDTIYTMETFNSALHDPLIRSPLWIYKQKSHIDTKGVLLDRVRVEASGYEKVLSSPLTTVDFSLVSGILNLSGHNITSKDGVYVGPFGNFVPNGLTGATISSTGDFILVGSPTNYINLLPDSGSNGWIINAYGDNRAYYTNVRASNAATGNPIYAYISNNYGANTNWIFSGGAGVSGQIDISISGSDGSLSTDGFIPLSIWGKSGDASGFLYLSITGGTPASSYANLDLFISGGIVGTATGGLYLSLVNSGVDGSIPLYIRGDGISSGFVPLGGVLYLTIANSGSSGSIPISILGGGSVTGGFAISLFGGSGISGGLPISISSFGSVASNINGLRLYSHARHASP